MSFLYSKYDDGIYRIRKIFGIKIATKPLENKLNDIQDKLNNIQNIFNNTQNRLNELNKEISSLDIRNKARMQLLSMGDERIIKPVRNEKLIISLTTYPQRISDIDVVIFSLINQSIKADKIILWLAYEEFPNLEKDIPNHILNLKKFGLEIEFCHNIYSYKKLIYALEKYPNDLIVTADDDIYYPYNWLEKLYKSYLENPNVIHCHRAFRIQKDSNDILPINNWIFIRNVNKEYKASYQNYFTTGGGVIFKKSLLHEDIFKQELFLGLALTDDDKWFFCMAILKGTKINVVDNNIADIFDIGYKNYNRLYDINKTGINFKIFLRLLDYYKLKDRIIYDN